MNFRKIFIYGILLLYFFAIPSQCQNYRNTGKSICELIVEHYHKCKHLKWNINELGKYEIDSSILNNSLNESFYESTLGEVTLEQALDLHRDIYLAGTDLNCSSGLCKCLREFTSEYFKNVELGFVFGNKIIYHQFKQLIINYVNGLPIKNVTFSTPQKNFCSKYNFFSFVSDNLGVFESSPCLDLSKYKVCGFSFLFQFE